MANATKAVMWSATWTPWGSPHAITGPATLDARFPGQWFQLESALHYNWHRHYDPSLGRYTQPDPLGFVDGPSVFGYVRSSPQSTVDPYGLWGVGLTIEGNIAGLPGGVAGTSFGWDSEIGAFMYFYGGASIGAGAGYSASVMGYGGSVCDLAGPGFSASVGAGPYTASGFGSVGSKAAGATFGLSWGSPASVNATGTYTRLSVPTQRDCKCRQSK